MKILRFLVSSVLFEAVVFLLIFAYGWFYGITDDELAAVLSGAYLIFLVGYFWWNSRKSRRGLLKMAAILAVFVLAIVWGYHMEQQKQIPQRLLDFAEKYPQAREFVNAYPTEAAKEHDMDISGEVQQGTIPYFIQWDKRWGYETYGNGYIADAACGPTCMSMIVCGLTGNTEFNPYEAACYAQENGYYISGQGTAWSFMTDCAEHFGLKVTSGQVSEDYIREYLSEQTPMICSMYPGDFTYAGHFIVLTGFDEAGNIRVHDPNSPENTQKTWTMEEILPQIHALWGYVY